MKFLRGYFYLTIPTLLLFVFYGIGLISQNYIPLDTSVTDGFPWLAQTTNFQSFFFKLNQTWDTLHFTAIASGGYDNQLYAMVQRLGDNYLYAFFPLLPFQFYLVSKITGIIFAAGVVALLNLLFFTAQLKKFLTLNNTISPQKQLLLTLLLPFSIFLFAPYTESLYLGLFFAFLNTFFYLKSSLKRNILLIIIIFLLSLTRSVATMVSVALVLSLIYEFWNSKTTVKAYILEHKQKLISSACIIGANILGILSFLYFGYLSVGNFWVSRQVQALWGRSSTNFIFEPVIRGFQETLTTGRISRGLFAIGVVSIIFYLVWKKYKKELLSNKAYLFMLIYSVLAVILPLTSNSLASIHRYILAAPIMMFFVPKYLVDFTKDKNWLYYSILVCFSVFFFFTSLFFLNHYWIG
jgi:hypothetical protein